MEQLHRVTATIKVARSRNTTELFFLTRHSPFLIWPSLPCSRLIPFGAKLDLPNELPYLAVWYMRTMRFRRY